MNIVFLCFSRRGEAVAQKLVEARPADEASLETVVRPAPGTLASAVSSWWDRADALVFVASLGIAVRAVAPHLSDKAADPAVIVVTEDGGAVLPVTGAHLGGGRDLAERLSRRLGVKPLLTTSSDRAGFTAPDLLSSRWGWPVRGRDHLAAANAKLIESDSLSFWTDIPELLPPLPGEYAAAEMTEASLIISPRRLENADSRVQLVPRCISAGIGCRRGIPSGTIRSVLFQALEAHALLPESLKEIRTVEEKMDEPGLNALAAELNIPLVIVGRHDILALEERFTPSAASRRLGLPGVAEPCAASAGTLLGPRTAGDGVTVALALSPARTDDPQSTRTKREGKLLILGTGPGNGEYLTLACRRALEEADAVVGYSLYVDLLPREWLEGKLVERYAMGEEEKRVERAVGLAEEGRVVALLSGGDPVLFGLAGLALRTAHGRVEAAVFPGLTAVQAAGILLGAPYVNGIVQISLSDYLQPWSAVLRAMEGAALSGLTVALYNPVKRDLDGKIGEVRRIFSAQGYSAAHLVRDAGRAAPSVRRIPLDELSAEHLDMRTLILLPGSSVEDVNGMLLDRRGYRRERAGHETVCPEAVPAEMGIFL
jgi:cobalt-precorrin 5A hydrolase/precorrin-3B C17-methyltransferase